MVAGKLIIIPALGHQNKGKSSFTGSGLFVLMSQCGNNNELARHHVPCDRLLQKTYLHTVAKVLYVTLTKLRQRLFYNTGGKCWGKVKGKLIALTKVLGSQIA